MTTISSLNIDTKTITIDNLKKDTEFVIQGNILNENKELVIKGIPVCKELSSFDELREIYEKDIHKYRFRKFMDGTMIRVYNYQDKWYVSTNRCLEAKQSKWGSNKSFGDYFYELLTKLYHKEETFENEEELFNKWFNKNFTYYFLIGSKEMNVVENIEEDYIYLLSVLDKEFKEVDNWDFIYKFVPELKKEDMNNDNLLKEENRGFMIYNTNERYVYFVNNYQEKRNKFGNEKYLGLRLIDLIWDKEKHLLEQYLDKYPEHKRFVGDIKNTAKLFCKEAHILYKRRYIQKQFIQSSPELHYFVKKMYENYLNDIKNGLSKPTLLKDIEDKFYEYSKYSKFVFLRDRLSLINPKLVGNYKSKLNSKKQNNNVVSNNVELNIDYITYESEFPPLN